MEAISQTDRAIAKSLQLSRQIRLPPTPKNWTLLESRILGNDGKSLTGPLLEAAETLYEKVNGFLPRKRAVPTTPQAKT